MADLGKGATGAKPSAGTTRAATSGPVDTTGAPSAAIVVRKRRRSLRHELRCALRYGWWWKRTFYWPTLRGWTRLRYGVKVPPTMLAKLGRGDYVDVIQRGPYIDIVAHHDLVGHGMIRLVPYQPNHGLMVERWVDGRMLWRTHLGYELLCEIQHAESDFNYRQINAQIAELDAMEVKPNAE